MIGSILHTPRGEQKQLSKAERMADTALENRATVGSKCQEMWKAASSRQSITVLQCYWKESSSGYRSIPVYARLATIKVIFKP